MPVEQVSTIRPAGGPDGVLYSSRRELPPMFDELWSEIQDMPGEIFDMDIPELKDEKFDVNEYLNGNIDY